jgi:hypothetical protein
MIYNGDLPPGGLFKLIQTLSKRLVERRILSQPETPESMEV